MSCKQNPYSGYYIASGNYMCCNTALNKYGMIDMSNAINKYMMNNYGPNSRYSTMNEDNNEYTTPPLSRNLDVVEGFEKFYWADNLRGDYTAWSDQPYAGGKYGQMTAKKRLLDVIREFGDVDTIDRRRGGSAIWEANTLQKRGKCFTRIELLDEQVVNTIPTPHVEFLYASIKMNIPTNKISDATSITPSSQYDATKKVLTVRSDSMGAIKAIMVLIKRFVTGEMSLGDAKRNMPSYIMSTLVGSTGYKSENEMMFENELCKYVSSLK